MGASRLVSAGRGSTSGSGRYPSAFRGPPLDAARRSTWEPRGSFQTHTRSLTVPFAHGARAGASLDRHTVDAHTFAHGARARFTLDTHLGASRLVSAGRGSTSGSERCPSAFRGPARRSTWEPRGSFLLAGAGSGRYPSAFRGLSLGSPAALQALDGTRARFGAPFPLMLQGQHFRLDGTRARFGAPPP